MRIHCEMDEQGRDICARCLRVFTLDSFLTAQYVPDVEDGLVAVCFSCMTRWEVLRLNETRRRRGEPVVPVGPELSSSLLD
jgi:hypothetical protein